MTTSRLMNHHRRQHQRQRQRQHQHHPMPAAPSAGDHHWKLDNHHHHHHHHNGYHSKTQKKKRYCRHRMILFACSWMVYILALGTNIRWAFQLGNLPSPETSAMPIDAFGWGVPLMKRQSNKNNNHPKDEESIIQVQTTDSVYLQTTNNSMTNLPEGVWDFSPIVLEDYNLIFFAMPPATLWKRLFRRMMGYKDWKVANPHDSKHNGLVYLRDYNVTKATEFMFSPKYTRTMFVRDPLEKFYTVYHETVLTNDGALVRQLCCPLSQKQRQEDCFQSPNQTPENFLQLIDETQCRDVRWASITERLETKYWKYINFVGHWDTVDVDTQELLERLGIWNLFGASGWGKNGQQSLSSQLMLVYQPNRRKQRMKYFFQDNARERLIQHVYRRDYENPKLGFASKPALVEPYDYIYSKDVTQWDASPIVMERYQLVFFTIPKNACTTWKMLFRRINGAKNYQDQDERRGLPHDPTRNGLRYLWSYSLEEANRIMTSPKYTRAIFVRDPKERFLSAYLDKAMSMSMSSTNFIYRKCCRNTTQNAQIRDELACSGKFLSVEEFLTLIHQCLDVHWLPQHYRMEDKYWPMINFVGRFETIEDDAHRLLRQIGAWDEFGATGWGKYAWKPIFHKGSNRHQTHTTDSRAKYSMYMTPELEQRVEDYYSVDYKNPKLGFLRNGTTTRNQPTTKDGGDATATATASLIKSLKDWIEEITYR